MMERWQRDTTWRSYLAEVALWPLTVGAYSVCYWSQVQVVFQHAFKHDAIALWDVSWSSLIWGLSTELGALVALFEAREASHRGTPSWGAWIIACACTAMSLLFNLLAGGGDWIGVIAHVWMPLLALGCWAWILEGRRVKWNPRWRERFGRNPTAPQPARTLERTAPPAAAPETRPVARARHASPPAANHSNGHAPVVVAKANEGPCEICGQDPCPESIKHKATLRKRRQRERLQEATA
jgi:hypothetical protein